MTFMWKRLSLLSLPLALLAQGACGQSQEALQERYEAKIGQDWFVDGGWSDDYDAVRARAKKEGKVILVYFTRSYSP